MLVAMSLGRIGVVASLLLALAGSASQVAAQPSSNPARYVERPLTLPKGTLRVNTQLHIVGFEAMPSPREYDVATRLGVGAAFGIIDDFEVGASSQPIMSFNDRDAISPALSPDPDVLNSYLYARYRFLAGRSVQIAAEAGVELPWDDDVAFVFALPIRIQAGRSFALDTGVGFRIDTDPFVPTLMFPIRPRFNVGNVYFGFDTGVFVTDFDADQVRIPLEFELGVGIPLGRQRRHVLDIYGHGGLPLFLVPARDDPVVQQIFIVTIGARVYIDT